MARIGAVLLFCTEMMKKFFSGLLALMIIAAFFMLPTADLRADVPFNIRDAEGNPLEMTLLENNMDQIIYYAALPDDTMYILAGDTTPSALVSYDSTIIYINGEKDTGPDLDWDEETGTYTIPLWQFKTSASRIIQSLGYGININLDDALPYAGFRFYNQTEQKNYYYIFRGNFPKPVPFNIRDAEGNPLQITELDTISSSSAYYAALPGDTRYILGGDTSADYFSDLKNNIFWRNGVKEKGPEMDCDEETGVFTVPLFYFRISAEEIEKYLETDLGLDDDKSYAAFYFWDTSSGGNGWCYYIFEGNFPPPNPDETDTFFLREKINQYEQIEQGNYTDYSWNYFQTALNHAKDLLASLYDEEGNPTAVNVPAYQSTVDAEEAALDAARQEVVSSEGIEGVMVYYEPLAYLVSRCASLKEADFEETSWQAFYEVYSEADTLLKEKGAPSVETYLRSDTRKIQSLRKALYKAYYYELQSKEDEISVSLRVADNLSSIDPTLALTDDKTATFSETLTLSGENRNLSGAVAAADLSFADASNTPYFNGFLLIFVNGVMLGDPVYGRNDDQSLSEFGVVCDREGRQLNNYSSYHNISLHDGDEVVIFRSEAPYLNYPYGQLSANYLNTYKDSVKMLTIAEKGETALEATEGEPFELTLTATSGIPSAAAEEGQPAEGISLVYGPAAETAAEVKGSGRISADTSDKDGKISLTLYKPGWYYVSAQDLHPQIKGSIDLNAEESPGEYPQLAAADGILVHVLPLTAAEREERLAEYDQEIDRLLNSYDEELIGKYLWKQMLSRYHTAKAAIIGATDLETAQNALNSAKEDFDELLGQAEEANERAIASFAELQAKLPTMAEIRDGLFDQGYLEKYLALVDFYETMTPYQRDLLSGSRQKWYDAITAAYAENDGNLPAAQEYTIKIRCVPEEYGENIRFRSPSIDYGDHYEYLPETTLEEPLTISMTPKNRFRLFASSRQGDFPNSYVMYDYDCDNEDIFISYSSYGSINKQLTISGTLQEHKDVNITLYFRDSEVDPIPLEEVIAAAKEELTTAYRNYAQKDYTAANWLTLSDAYGQGMINISAAETAEEVTEAKAAALSAMAAVEPRGAGEYGSVSVIVKNETYEDAPFTGEIVNETIELTEDDTMMTCVLRALAKNDFSWTGTGGSGMGIGYLSFIIKDGESLGEFDSGDGGGWMGSINDWIVNEGFPSFGVANKKLHDGDRIMIEYTCELGADIYGGVQGNTDTRLRQFSLANGTLTPAFDPDITEYVFTLDEGKDTTSFDCSGFNRGFQIRGFLGEYTPSAQSWISAGDEIRVDGTTTLYIGVGERAWPSMGSADRTLYTINVITADGVAVVENMIEQVDIDNKNMFDAKNYLAYDNNREWFLKKLTRARNSYNALPDAMKEEVSNADKLFAAEALISQLDIILDIRDKLAELPKLANLGRDDVEAVREVSELYTELEADSLDYMTIGEQKRLNGMITFLDQVAAEDVEALIEAIGEVSLESKDAIDTARAAYEALSNEQKAFVGNIDALIAAEAAYKNLEINNLEVPLIDIEGHWGEDDINYVFRHGLMNGIGNNRFAPDGEISRGMVVTVLYRIDGKPAVDGETAFTDVQEGQYYRDAVIWAAENDIVNGVSETAFAPNRSISREQLAAMIYRYARYKGIDISDVGDLSAYNDADQVSEWAKEAMGWANKAGLIRGRSKTELAPSGTTTRAEFASIITRYIKNIAE